MKKTPRGFFLFTGMLFAGMSWMFVECGMYGIAVFSGLMANAYFFYAAADDPPSKEKK